LLDVFPDGQANEMKEGLGKGSNLNNDQLGGKRKTNYP